MLLNGNEMDDLFSLFYLIIVNKGNYMQRVYGDPLVAKPATS